MYHPTRDAHAAASAEAGPITVYTHHQTAYLLDLVAGADGLASGGSDLVCFLDGGCIVVIVNVDAAAVVGPHQRVRLVHPDVLRIHLHRGTRNVPLVKRESERVSWRSR